LQNIQTIQKVTLWREELDFYINGDLQWCLELLRLGEKIGEHLARFDSQAVGEEYHDVVWKEYLVLDCRGPKKGLEVIRPTTMCDVLFTLLC
jgi:hypothetical protein